MLKLNHNNIRVNDLLVKQLGHRDHIPYLRSEFKMCLRVGWNIGERVGDRNALVIRDLEFIEI